jgi:hypothetical protein
MRGIAALFSPEPPPLVDLVPSMPTALCHRGQDGEWFAVFSARRFAPTALRGSQYERARAPAYTGAASEFQVSTEA